MAMLEVSQAITPGEWSLYGHRLMSQPLYQTLLVTMLEIWPSAATGEVAESKPLKSGRRNSWFMVVILVKNSTSECLRHLGKKQERWPSFR